MSTQKGNTARTRPQKHRNKSAFKNDLHDTSHTIKFINKIEINNVCEHCKGVLEWKIKYKKYKPLKAPATCVTCHQKTVKHSYHTICTPCATNAKVCPKCGKSGELVMPSVAVFDESILKTGEALETLKKMSERRRRTFNRFVRKTVENGVPGQSVEGVVLDKLKELSLDSQQSDSEDDNYNEDSN